MVLRETVRTIGICLGLLTAVALLAPLQFQEYACFECGAYRPQFRVLYVPVLWKTSRPKLYRYWLRNVDPRHIHKFVELERTESVGLFIPRRHATYSAWCNLRWDIEEPELIGALRSLPNPAGRRSFMDALWRAGDGTNRMFAEEVHRARQENRTRTDWPRTLAELGLWVEGR